jgi:ribosomal-protein-alanine N-acetyltransferase
MEQAFIYGKRINLRGLEEKDLTGNYFHWFNDQQVCEFNSHGLFPNSINRMKHYFESVSNSRTALVLAIIHRDTNSHIGNVSLQQIDWLSRAAEFAIIMGERNYWGKGFATEASKMIVEHGFSALNLNRIHCGTSADNKGMRKLAAALMMTQEGVRRQAMYKNGIYKDMIEYGVLRDEFLSAMKNNKDGKASK